VGFSEINRWDQKVLGIYINILPPKGLTSFEPYGDIHLLLEQVSL